MTLYKVEYSYLQPNLDMLMIPADDPDEAEEEAKKDILRLYPEAEYVTIIAVIEDARQ